MTEPRFSSLRDSRAFILEALRAEMSKRADHDDWVERERLAVTIAANEWAQANGLQSITVDDVRRVETLAVGHVDYATKLALYVSELIHDARTVPSNDP